MHKHSQHPDPRWLPAVIGAHQARDALAEQRRHRRDLQTVEASPDAVPRLLDQGGPDRCRQPGCLNVARWCVRFRRGTTHRPAYRRLCTRDAARRIRRRAHTSTTRRDQTR